MKLTLTTSIDCRRRFRKSDGSVYMFPGQDFTPLGGPTDNEKCREIYVGIDVIDKLHCEPMPPGGGGGSYSNVSSGRSPESPPSEPSVIVPPPVIDCTCNITAKYSGPIDHYAYLEVENIGTCDLVFDATCDNPNIIIDPSEGIGLLAGATTTLTLNCITGISDSADIYISTDVGCDFTIYCGSIPELPTADELDTRL